MKIEIFDTGEFIELNELQEVTSPIVFQRGNVPDPKGLLSTEIFGIDVRSRKNTFAYIDLGRPFFQPHVYKALKKLYRNVEYILNGAKYYRIEDGKLVEDPENGETGLDFLYDNWSKIKWERSLDEHTVRNERIDLLTKTKKNEIFTNYQLVIPVFYRDILGSKTGGETDPLNNLYCKELRMVSLLKDRDMFDFTMHSTNYNVQHLMVEIYDTFKHKLERKNGMIRKYLMGKNVDNCTRSVISCPLYHDNTPETTGTRFAYAGIPVAQIISLCYPFMSAWLKNFFEREFILPKESKVVMRESKNGEVEYLPLYKPELYFTDKYIKKISDLYVRDPECRFDPILVPVGKDEYGTIAFTGKKLNPGTMEELSTISNRPMTLTDLFYMAACDIVKDKHTLITRYPVSDAYGLFVARVNPVCTLQTEVVQINGQVYRHYPKVEVETPKNIIPIRFIDTVQFSNSYLAGLGGDYDGDQVTVKIIWSQEANAEIEEVMNSKSFYISPSGSNVRSIKYECLQTMYDLTKDPGKDSKKIVGPERDAIVKMDPKDITFDYMVGLFADRRFGKETRKSKYNVNDIIVLKPGELRNKETVTTTIGRVIWNKFMVDRVGLSEYFQYNNNVQTKKNYGKYEAAVTLLLREDKIPTTQFRDYLEHRDWLGLQLHSIITISFTEATIRTPDSVKKLRDELFKKYEKELASGDVVAANKVEKALIDATVDLIKDDPGFDLYASGARGDINNHLKNLFLMRGAVLNPNTGKFEIMKSSFNEGLRKEDFTPASNSVVQGAYFKSVSTADSGYLAKQLMAGMQTEILDDPGTDCGTKGTINFLLTEEDANDFQYRNINDNGKVVMLTPDNMKHFIGKEVKMYSPMYCAGKHICSKCAGKVDNKFIGLDTNKIATTLTNLNMKKFHDSTLRFYKIKPDGMLIGADGTNLFKVDGDNVVLTSDYFEIYVPTSYFTDLNLAEDLGNMVNLFGLVPVGIFDNGKLKQYATLNIPSWHKYNVFEAEERAVNIAGMGDTACKVLKYYKGHQICGSSILEDSANAQLFLRQITYGKVPPTIPYSSSIHVWRKNAKINAVNFGVPSVIQEVVLSCAYRYKKDPSMKYATAYGMNPKISEYDYEMAGIRRICQVTSTFSGITFESFDDMVTTSLNRAREHGTETESPLEILFKL